MDKSKPISTMACVDCWHVVHAQKGTETIKFPSSYFGSAVTLCGKTGGKWGSPKVATCPDCLDIISKRYVLYTGE